MTTPLQRAAVALPSPPEEERDDAILRAAFEVLRREGYRGATMLAIATEARASKATLYARFGDKAGLFHALIHANAAAARAALEDALVRDAPLAETLERFGAVLVRMLTGERAVAINRAAAVDAERDGSLGRTLATAGRGSVLPLLVRVMAQAITRQEVGSGLSAQEAAEAFLGLAIGDWQIRRVIGAAQAAPDEEIAAHVKRAATLTLRLMGPALGPRPEPPSAC